MCYNIYVQKDFRVKDVKYNMFVEIGSYAFNVNNITYIRRDISVELPVIKVGFMNDTDKVLIYAEESERDAAYNRAIQYLNGTKYCEHQD